MAVVLLRGLNAPRGCPSRSLRRALSSRLLGNSRSEARIGYAAPLIDALARFEGQLGAR
jgi:hypothetical protein